SWLQIATHSSPGGSPTSIPGYPNSFRVPVRPCHSIKPIGRSPRITRCCKLSIIHTAAEQADSTTSTTPHWPYSFDDISCDIPCFLFRWQDNPAASPARTHIGHWREPCILLWQSWYDGLRAAFRASFRSEKMEITMRAAILVSGIILGLVSTSLA